ncbi:MAG TPA: hypothetical protein VJT31_21675 [Rugosimonospora sp.]|nr:hypothetical protein [Rugosimonospora sp.]
MKPHRDSDRPRSGYSGAHEYRRRHETRPTDTAVTRLLHTLQERWRSGTRWVNYTIIAGGAVVLGLLIGYIFVLSRSSTNGPAPRPNTVDAGQNGMAAASAGAAVPSDGPSGGRAYGSPVPSPAAPSNAATGTVGVYLAADTTHTALGPSTELRDVAGVPGGKVVTKVGHGTPAGDVTFNAVAARNAGTYNVVIYYMLADTVAHRLALWVNGNGPTILSFPPLGAGATNTMGTYRVTVTLKAGSNTIRFSNATMKYGPDLNRITVAPRQ